MVVVGQPGCMPCKMTVKKMNDLGIEHRYADVSEVPELVEAAVALGAQATPLVFRGTEFLWSGMRIDRIRELAA